MADLLEQLLRTLKDGLARPTGRVQELFSSTEIGVCLIGCEGRFERLNPAWESCLGHPLESMQGSAFLEFVHPDDRAATEAATGKLETKATVRFWNRFRQSDGSYRTLEWAAARTDDASAICAVVLASASGGASQMLREMLPVDEGLDAAGLGATPAELYRKVVEISPDAILVTDLIGRVLMVNEQAAIQNGLVSEEELIGLNAFDFIIPEDRARAVENARLTLETGVVRNVEYELLRRDGVRMAVDLSAALIRDPAGQPRGFMAAVRDITARKRAAEVQREAEERYRVLYQDNPTMYFTVDAGGKVLSVNQFGAEQLGYEAEELLGNPVLEVFVEEDKAAVSEQLAVCVQHPGEVNHWEFRKVRKDGRVIWVKEAARATTDANGETIVLIVCEDITESKRAEEALRASEERKAAILMTALDAIITIDHRSIILEFNPAAEVLFGYKAAEAVGSAMYDLIVPPSLRARHLRGMKRYLDDGEGPILGQRVEMTATRADGTEFPAEISIVPIHRKGPPLFTGQVRDLTERRRWEEELQRAREALENKVERQMARGRAYGLTFRELTVLHLVATGSSDKDIAEKLGISPLTVSKHVANILTKMGAASRSEASARAVRQYLLE
jgi:PAS domain S-box-containing protein